jgi:hypothetical protein
VEIATHEKQDSYQGMMMMDMGGGEANSGPEMRELGVVGVYDIKRHICWVRGGYELYCHLFL